MVFSANLVEFCGQPHKIFRQKKSNPRALPEGFIVIEIISYFEY